MTRSFQPHVPVSSFSIVAVYFTCFIAQHDCINRGHVHTCYVLARRSIVRDTANIAKLIGSWHCQIWLPMLVMFEVGCSYGTSPRTRPTTGQRPQRLVLATAMPVSLTIIPSECCKCFARSWESAKSAMRNSDNGYKTLLLDPYVVDISTQIWRIVIKFPYFFICIPELVFPSLYFYSTVPTY